MVSAVGRCRDFVNSLSEGECAAAEAHNGVISKVLEPGSCILDGILVLGGVSWRSCILDGILVLGGSRTWSIKVLEPGSCILDGILGLGFWV